MATGRHFSQSDAGDLRLVSKLSFITLGTGCARNINGMTAQPNVYETLHFGGITDGKVRVEEAKHSSQNRQKRTRCTIIVLISAVVVLAATTVAVGVGLGVVLKQKAQEPTICASTTSPTTPLPTTTSPTTSSPARAPTTSSTPKCIENWKPFRQSCYSFIRNPVNFDSAVDHCKSLNSHLVYVGSSEENKFIKDYITNSGTDPFWWIGLTDSEQEGTWKWVGTDRVASFTDWYPGNPDNHGGVENCAIYAFWANYDWNDGPCDIISNIICEKEQF